MLGPSSDNDDYLATEDVNGAGVVARDDVFVQFFMGEASREIGAHTIDPGDLCGRGSLASRRRLHRLLA